MTRIIRGAATLAAVLLLAGTARAADDISFKKRGDGEKLFVTHVGEAILHAAHTTAKKPALLKVNRTELSVKMEYYGAVTGKRYVAEIVVKIDSSNKDAWEVLNIEYADTNTGVTANLKKIQELIKEMNK
jgi:hypothetical protein